MRSQVAIPVVCAVLGGGITAATLLAAGVVTPGTRSAVIQQAAPLLTGGPVGGSAAGDVYRSESAGVVGVTARAVTVPTSAFDMGTARRDGALSGSGFVLDATGRILTAAHLVRAASDVRVTVAGRTLPARVLGVDEIDDLALLEVDPGTLELHALELTDSDAVRVGDSALAIGHPTGLQPTLTTATISARQPELVSSSGAAIADALQIDAPLHAGDCGGPLLDASGRVTGVNTRMVAASGDTVELAVPASTVRRVLPRLTGEAMKVVGG
jgi:S1-C subfamily serine protease